MAYTLITGASGGIGLALAKEFASHKHDLILVARSEDKLRSIQNELYKIYGVNVVIFTVDLSKEEERNKLFEETQRNRLEVEILVNNAGYGDANGYLDASWERQKNLADLNMMAVMHLSYLYGSEMKN